MDALRRGTISLAEQQELVDAVRRAARMTPFFVPKMPGTGAPFRVQCLNFGSLGWCSTQARGYHYSRTHPETGDTWLPIPSLLRELWQRHVSNDPALAPECCLVNRYGRGGRLGLHVDADEEAQTVPVLSVSLGDTAIFRVGGLRRDDTSETMQLRSGDVIVLGGPHRRVYHGIDKVFWRTSSLLNGGRLVCTLRRVTRAR